MNNVFGLTAIVALLGAGFSPAALADKPETRGGLTIKSEDGRFEGSLGGRIHMDANLVDDDQLTSTSGLFVRRAYVTLSGALYGYKYKLETDAKGATLEAKEMWIGKSLLGGFLKAGHMQPAYGMESQTSSNELLFMERPFISNNTVFSGREFQNAVGYNTGLGGLGSLYVTYYDAGVAADKDAAKDNEGTGIAARATFAPLNTDAAVVHLGVSFDNADYSGVAGGPKATAKYVAKQGPGLDLVAAGYNSQQTITGELAGKVGPFFGQAEYAQARYQAPAAADQTLQSYYAQLSFYVTGESKPYKTDKGVFGSAKPADPELGAIELKARYDFAKNDDAAGKPEATTTTLGANYYVNPNVRFMLEYSLGEARVSGTTDKPKAVTARAQISF